MSRAARFFVTAAVTGWLTWACGSTNSGQSGPGNGPADGGEAMGGEVGSGATTNKGGSNQRNGGAGNDGNVAGADSGLAGADVGVGGSGGPFGPSCSPVRAACVQSTDCCSGLCDPSTDTCTFGACSEAGKDCASPLECCSFQCNAAGKCGADTCTSDTEACQIDSDCCSGSCLDGACGTLNTECKTAGNSCAGQGECCSGQCGEQGTCTLGGSWCIQPGDVCASSNECCTGDCYIADGKQVGVCLEQPAGSAFCKGVDGVLCGSCGDCCSRLCAPFGPTGTMVCQPANGCHVTGDLCRRNEDCCGGTDDETLPGWGNVRCEIEPGKQVGLCRNPSNGTSPGGACNPQGNVCHFKNYACDISSTRANCCGGLGAKGGVCQLDPLGIPRCNGLGDDCREAGETCASTDDCCEDRPCVPDANGDLRCGTGECQRTGNSCTINADCCPGGTCIRAPGSTVGTCGGDPGDPGGSGGAGSGDGGAPGTGVGGSGNTSCSEYGQLCDGASDCCNAVPCSDGLCRYAGG